VNPRTERGRRTRTALLEAARTAFEQRGFDDCRMNDIADAAGVSHGTVYTYFASKEDVLRELVDAIAAEVVAAVRVPDDVVEPYARIDAANRRYLSAYARHHRMLEVVGEVAGADPYYADLLARLRAGLTRRAADGIRRLQRDGRADPALDPDAAAPLLCGMVEALAARSGAAEPPDPALATLTRLWAQAIGLPPVPAP
jgi:AcrR family transcriptional regulator